MEGHGRKPKKQKMISSGKSGGYNTKARDIVKEVGEKPLRHEVDEGENRKIYGQIEKDGRDDDIPARPNGHRGKLGTIVRAGDSDLPGRRKRHTSDRVGEEVEGQNCPYDEEMKSRPHCGGVWTIQGGTRNI